MPLHPKTVALLQRLKEKKVTNPCKACEGSGKSSRGWDCYPCYGTGKEGERNKREQGGTR
jgi:DnaJ-class molecular chaperone